MTRKIRLLCLHGAREQRRDADADGGARPRRRRRCRAVLLGRAGGRLPASPFVVCGRSELASYEANPPGTPEARAELAESLASVAAHVQQPSGPFDGAFGFSQGLAAVITILSDARVWKEMGLRAAPWRFVVLACGVDYLVREHTGVEVCCTVPSLHLLGDADPFLMESELLLGRFSDRVGVALRPVWARAAARARDPPPGAPRGRRRVYTRAGSGGAGGRDAAGGAGAARRAAARFCRRAAGGRRRRVVGGADAAAPIVAQRPEVWEWRALAAAAARKRSRPTARCSCAAR